PAGGVVGQPIPVLDFGHDGAAQGGDAALDEPQSPTGRDQIETPGRRLRSIASPMAARKTAKAKRTFEAFECSSSRVPRFVPEKSPMNILMRVDRKSTRLNSSHVKISYAVFCLKKKTGRAAPEE